LIFRHPNLSNGLRPFGNKYKSEYEWKLNTIKLDRPSGQSTAKKKTAIGELYGHDGRMPMKTTFCKSVL
tara:strand:+ start:267 stop:473 length:207 start_codon:yes stop_codon:yes gene_type:complete